MGESGGGGGVIALIFCRRPLICAPFSTRWYRYTGESPCELHPVSRKSPVLPLRQFNARLINDGPLSPSLPLSVYLSVCLSVCLSLSLSYTSYAISLRSYVKP